ncbi:MAG TPA: hypothetical protein VEI97_11340, partial [bacterium]|nr:hypothetical protein [bacterium]
MPFEVMFEDQPYPLPPELLPLPLDLLPTDAAPDKLALFDSIGRLQRDVTRLSGRLQLNVKTQAEAMAKVEEAVQSVEDRL